MKPAVSLAALLCSAAALPLCAPFAYAATIHLNPGGNFETAVESLAPGDTLVVHAGDYITTGRISITVRGTAAQPVVIEAAAGEARPHIRRAATAAAQNTINIEGATYLTIRGLEISSNGGDGINLNGNPAFITLENLEIHDVDVGVNFRSSMNNITVRNSHIYRTGADGGTGEGMYIGCNDAACVVRDSLIERNWIHDTRNSTQGDGIEVKLGSYNVIVRDNVIHDTGYPCVLVYGTNGNPVNIVEGNAMWNCGDSGIQAAADAIIRNNLILESPGSNGFNSQPHQAAVPQNLQFVHNTIIGGSPCVRLSSWNGRPGLVFANNAIYCDSDNFVVGGLAGVTVSGNVIAPATSAFPSSGYRVGQARSADLTNVAARNVYPTAASRLIDAGAAQFAAAVDFNGRSRTAAPEAGAYEWVGNANPGWTVAPGFKGAAAAVPAPDVTLTANPASITAGSSTTLSWSSANASGCTASSGIGSWPGAKGTSGSTSVGPISATTTFGLSCTGSGGTTDRSVVVAVSSAPPPAAPQLTLSASASSVTVGGNASLTWSSTDTTSCTASGSWSGTKAASGSETVGPINSNATYSLACTGAGGSVNRSVSITANPAPAPPAPTNNPTPPPTTTDDSSGSGSFDLLALSLLLSLLAFSKRSLLQTALLAFARPRATPALALLLGIVSVGAARAADIVTIDVVNTSATALTDAPVTFGHVFVSGDVTASTGLQARLDDGTPVPLQVDRKATHANGSLRHAVLTLRMPSIAASATRRVTLATGTTATGTAPSLSELLATNFDAQTSISIGGVTYSASARTLLNAGSGVTTWLQGPLASEWIVRGPLRRSDGTAHPHLAAQFEVRAYAGAQRARVGVSIENIFTRVASPQRYTYDLTVTVPGRGTVLSRTAVPHYRQSRWRRLVWWGTEPTLDVRHDSRYMISTGAVPSYDMNLQIPSSALTDMVNDFNGASGLMDVGNLNPDMPAGGGRPEIAPLPGFAARYVVSQDLRAKRVMVGHGEQAGTWPMHYRDEATGLPLSIDQYPNVEILGSGIYGNFAACGGNCSVPFTPETAHHPSLAFLPYIVTGDYYHLEELQFWANWVMIFAPASRRNGSEGLVVWDQTRGQAWGLRTLGQAVYATPDNHPLKSYFTTKLQNNLRYYNANWLNSNPLGYITLTGPTEWLGLRRWIATWMDDFVTWSFGYLVELGFEDARAMRDWKALFPTGRMTHPDMCWIMASTYWPTIMDNVYLGGSGNAVRTWADYKRTIVLGWSNDAFPADARGNMAGREQALLNAACDSPEMQQILGLPRGWMMGYGGSPDGYPANLQPALAIAVDAGIPNAAAGWTKFRTAASYPDYSTDPQWAVVPRGTQTTPPNPAPTVNLVATPTSITSGQSSSLSWTTQNATSCTASGGWTGTKATSGSQAVGPLTTNTTYTLSCTGAGGTGSASATVTVTAAAQPPTLTLTAAPTTIASGATSTLTWSTTNATACSASGAWTGTKAINGTEATAALTANATYTLNCTGAGGSVSRSVTVTVSANPPPPSAPTVTLSAAPTSVTSGSRATLSWTSENATACTATGAWSGSKATSGSEQTSALTADASYTLSCTGPGGSTNRAITVTVTAPTPPPPPPPTPDPPAPERVEVGGAMHGVPLALLALIALGRVGRSGRRRLSASWTSFAIDRNAY